MTLPSPTTLDLDQAQADMRWAYWHGAFGVLTSALAWSLAAGAAAFGQAQQAVWTLLIAGMFIHPVSMALARLAGRPGMHAKGNPLGRLAMISTVGLVAGCGLALFVATRKLEWFFPTMLVVIGLRYLAFARVYGLPPYLAFGLGLAATGLLLGTAFAPASALSKPLALFIGAATGAALEAGFGAWLLSRGRGGIAP